MPDPDKPLCGIPPRLVAGDSWAWLARLPAPSAGVTVSVALRPLVGGRPVTVPTVAEGSRLVARLPAPQSVLVAPGVYIWTEIASRASDGARWTGADGRVEVAPDPAATGGDARSSAERILDAIDARLAGRVTDDCDAYTIEGRSITRTPLDILMRVRGIYARQVSAERGRGGVQFNRVGFR